jgi:hypothetical protein
MEIDPMRASLDADSLDVCREAALRKSKERGVRIDGAHLQSCPHLSLLSDGRRGAR